MKKKALKKSSSAYIKFIIVLLILPIVVFSNTLSFEFVWDDEDLYLNKRNFPVEFTFNDFAKFWNPLGDKMYMPVTYSVWACAMLLSDSDSRFDSTLFHLINLLFHALNGILVYILLRKLLNDDISPFFGALLFLFHPLQVESVSWVSDLRGIMAASFSFLSLFFFLSWDDRKSNIKSYILSLILFLFALLSKPSAITFPLIIFAFAAITMRLNWKKLFLQVLPFIIIAIPIMIRAKFAESQLPPGFESPIWARPLIFFDSLQFYLAKLMLPFDLVADYARKPAIVMQSGTFYYSWIIPLAVGIVLYYLKKFSSIYIVSYLIFIAGFLTLSGLVSFYFQDWSTVADRYVYISMFGFSLAIAKLHSSIKNKNLISLLLGLTAVICIGLSYIQTNSWRNEFALWDNVIEKNPGKSSHAYTGRGFIFMEKGSIPNALSDFNEAIKINPKNPRALFNRGNIYLDLNKLDSALADYNKAVELNFINPNLFYNRGLVHSELGMPDKAIIDYTRSIKIMPDIADVFSNRGVEYAKKGMMNEAIEDFRKALELNPNDEYTKSNLELALKAIRESK